MVSDFTWKKNFCSRKWCGGAGASPASPFPTVLIQINSINKINLDVHRVKCVPSGIYSGPYFSVFGLNSDLINSEYGHFSRSGQFKLLWYFKYISSCDNFFLLHYIRSKTVRLRNVISKKQQFITVNVIIQSRSFQYDRKGFKICVSSFIFSNIHNN